MTNGSAFETNDGGSAFETKDEASRAASAFETKDENSGIGSAFETNDNVTESNSVYETEKPISDGGSAFGTSADESGFGSVEGSRNEEPKVPDIECIELETSSREKIILRDLYKLGKQGAMGMTYKGTLELQHGMSSRKVIFKQSLSSDPNHCRLFTNESELACRRCGPNVIAGAYYGVKDGYPFLVTEFYEGETLDVKIRTGKLRGREKECLRLAVGILEGVSQLMNHRIIHRDIKPENIMICEGDTPVILDLGLATQESYADLDMTAMGTKAYAPPEQKGEGGNVSYASDVYSVGLVLLEMYSGSADLSNIKKLPTGLRRFVEKCCKKKTSERYLSAREALAVLRQMQAAMNDPKKQRESFEEQVVRKFIGDWMIDDNERAALISIAQDLYIPDDEIQDEIDEVCRRVQEFRDESIVGNILKRVPDDLSLSEDAEKLHLTGSEWQLLRTKMIKAAEQIAVAYWNANHEYRMQVLEEYPCFKGMEAEICAKFRIKRGMLINQYRNTILPKKSMGKFGTKGRKSSVNEYLVAIIVLLIVGFGIFVYQGRQSDEPIPATSETSAIVKEKKDSNPVAVKPKNVEPKMEEAVEAVVPSVPVGGFQKPADFDEKHQAFDSRDGRIYRTVSFAGLTWLADNVSYAGRELSFAKCYKNAQSCGDLGRLYDYASARVACPAGFRLPTRSEWNHVIKKVGKKGSGKLRSDEGFAALNAGYYQKAADSYFFKGEYAGWWGVQERENGMAPVFNILQKEDLIVSEESEKDGYSVRCVKE